MLSHMLPFPVLLGCVCFYRHQINRLRCLVTRQLTASQLVSSLVHILLLSLTCLIFSSATCHANNKLPHLFLFLGGDEPSLHKYELQNSCVAGVQVIYSWQQLEPKKDVYDFTQIEKDLRYLKNIHKHLFIQLQDRSFEPTVFNVPDYIREDKIYHGGVAMQYDFPGEGKPMTVGWVARVWDPAVRERFQLLIKKMAAQFDGRIYGINLPETAVDFDSNNPPQDFTVDSYFNAVLDNMGTLRKAFHQSIVIQYVNFFPGEWNNDRHYMSRLFFYASHHQIGLGGPDVLPYRDAQMQNSYPFFSQYKGQLLTVMAIQEPDNTYKNPATGDGYQFSDFYKFSKNYLGATVLFWHVQNPYFSEQLLPHLNTHYFEC